MAEPSHGKTPYKGIHFERRYPNLPWRAAIRVSGRQFGLGSYATPEEAARAYDAAARLHFGEFARPNFPDDQQQAA